MQLIHVGILQIECSEALAGYAAIASVAQRLKDSVGQRILGAASQAFARAGPGA